MDLRDSIQRLVPWEISRISIAKEPKARRDIPRDVPVTHRGCATLTTGGAIEFESESIASVTQPRLRFASQIKFGVFFYGLAPDDQDRGDAERPRVGLELTPPEESEQHGIAQITFPNLSDDIRPPDIKKCLARMHINFAHCRRDDSVRWLSHFGAPPAAFAAVAPAAAAAAPEAVAPSAPAAALSAAAARAAFSAAPPPQ